MTIDEKLLKNKIALKEKTADVRTEYAIAQFNLWNLAYNYSLSDEWMMPIVEQYKFWHNKYQSSYGQQYPFMIVISSVE